MGFKRMTTKQAPSFQKILNAEKQVKSAIGTPQFPGITAGMNTAEVRQLIKQQPRCTGVSFSAPSGTSVLNNIQLPGDARILLGFIFTPGASSQDTFSVNVNNNLIIDSASVYLHSSDNGFTIKDQFFKYMQPLTGKDILKIDFNFTGNLNGILQIHYI